jgi:uncharacterized repeat protein (TIGR01451 family)
MKKGFMQSGRGHPDESRSEIAIPIKTKERTMKKTISAIAAVFGLLICAGGAFAATPAGTTITNTASASYSVAGTPQSVTSGAASFKVAQLVNVTVAWQDGGPIPVAPGETNRILTFKVTNTGNATDTFTLGINDLAGGWHPVATTQPIWVDTNLNTRYDGPGAANDTATGTLTLNPGESRFVFLANDIPGGASAPADASTGDSILSVKSTIANPVGGPWPLGKVFAGVGPTGVDAVLGVADGTASATGTYKISSVVVNLVKSSSILDPFGGTAPVPGATVTYTITATVIGSGTASGVTVTDGLPVNTTYKPGTLSLTTAGSPAVGLSDAKDGDAGDVGGTTPNTVTVTVGDMTSATPAKTVIFKVTIN